MKKLFTLLLTILLSVSLFASFDPSYSDSLFYNQGKFKEDFDYLEAELNQARSKEEKASILWRLSRTKLTLTDYTVSAEDKDARLSNYQVAWDYAQESIDTAPSADGYHWLASAMGRWGQTKGPLNALGKAKDMLSYAEKALNDFKSDNSDTWYVLGILYNSLPGGPISFGNNNYAISYMRRCLDTQDTVNRMNLTNYLELSNQLYDRNWDASKREKEFNKMKKNYDKESVPTEKMKYYEGKEGAKAKAYYSSVAQNKLSDRQEAVMLLRYADALYSVYTTVHESDTKTHDKIVARLADIT